ncbi:hypothetical protein [Nocardioides sp.]|uniref:hypothetical protein n=1 Tax=Nocardioides sp. TaxID=35761 RepID=UPI003569D9B5
MVTLHIEHKITDFPTWSGAFERFAEARIQAGVRHERVRRGVDDDCWVVIDLAFDTSDEAKAFREFLQTNVWGTPLAPALVGEATATILEDVSPAVSSV